MNAPSGPPEPMPLVEFRGVSKHFDGAGAVVDRLDLSIRPGEFLTLLGPSGSGKTTTLMMLAGFERPSSGDILLAGQSLADRPPHRRNMGVVFQNYALFPHMSVAQNLSFPLEVRGIGRAAANRKVAAALELVSLSGLGERRVNQLSGGQQQRVALARALIFDPDIVLMDEPLGALDRQLREKLQLEIKRIQRKTGITVLYVTHDQSEALALSDRIAIFSEGRVQQIDAPSAIYRDPANAFVAGFVGENNRLEGIVAAVDAGRCTVRTMGGHLIHARSTGSIATGDSAIVMIRPEQIIVGEGTDALANRFEASIEERVFHGDHCKLRLRIADGTTMFARAPGAVAAETATVGWHGENAIAFPVHASMRPEAVAA